MKLYFKYLFAVFIAAPLISFGQFTGGANDGYGSNTFCGNDLNGTAASAVALNAISGAGAFCSNNTEGYSVSISGSGIVNSFLWSAPAGTTLTQTQVSPTASSVNFLFGSTSGSVSVTVTDGCTTAIASLPVTSSTCNNFFGGNNDGFGTGAYCGNDLNGTSSILTLNAISGPGAFCSNNTEGYSVSLSGPGIANTFLWSSPSGSTMTQSSASLSTGTANFLFASTSGTISVIVNNGCTTSTATLPVTATNCGNFIGGNNDGFSLAAYCGADLNGTGAPSIALDAISGPGAFCSNNTEGYSTTLSSGITNNFIWAVPAGSALVQNTNTLTSSIVNYIFGSTSGTISVTVSDACSTATATLPLTATSCGNFVGANNDGFSFASYCGSDLNGTAATGIALNSITGPGAFCTNNTEGYSVSLSSGLTNSFIWTTPTGTVQTQNLNTLTSSIINFLFGTTSGLISVTVSDACSTATATLPVIATNCGNFFGANNDGFSFASFCGNDLNGTTSVLALNAINGSGAFCSNNTEGYSASLSSGIANSYSWSGPPGSVISQTSNTLNTSIINFLFAATSGTISVTATNNCSTATTSLPVTATTCGNFLGGSNDGFGFGKVVSPSLPIELLSFIAVPNKNEIDLEWTTESELDNNYFTVEKSRGDLQFQSVAIVKGAGTTNQANQYFLADKSPFLGKSYYRLKQTDFDGNSTYSEIVAVEFTPATILDFEVYPNPATGSVFNLSFNSAWEGKASDLQISDVTGRNLLSYNIICHPTVPVSFDRQIIEPGLYIIIIYMDDKKYVKKLVIQ